ncbi:MAG: type II secretion system minor pseudopilin GspH [Magnetococcales bacterium]|nr:type II secretion system minor pseudopilin GspH [Magnetococcales bacterium]
MSQRGVERGFTLLEILVVLLIIGVMMGMVVLSVAPRDAGKVAREELGRFKGMLELASRESVLEAREWGVRIAKDGYAFLVQDEKKTWQPPPSGERILQGRNLPEGWRIEWSVEGEKQEKELKLEDPPQILITSDGEMTPFELEVEVEKRRGVRERYRLSAGVTGRVRVERVERP